MRDLIHTGGMACFEPEWFCHQPRTVSSVNPIPYMNKKTEVVTGLVREKHPFHQAQTQPGKAKQHRYERRKVRNILKVGDWGEEVELEEAS